MIEDGDWTTAGSHTRHSATITWFEFSAFGKGGVQLDGKSNCMSSQDRRRLYLSHWLGFNGLSGLEEFSVLGFIPGTKVKVQFQLWGSYEQEQKQSKSSKFKSCCIDCESDVAAVFRNVVATLATHPSSKSVLSSATSFDKNVEGPHWYQHCKYKSDEDLTLPRLLLRKSGHNSTKLHVL